MKPPKKPSTVTIHIKLPVEQYAKLRKIADSDDRTIHYLALKVFKNYLEQAK
jgi:hypothetical protein